MNGMDPSSRISSFSLPDSIDLSLQDIHAKTSIQKIATTQLSSDENVRATDSKKRKFDSNQQHDLKHGLVEPLFKRMKQQVQYPLLSLVQERVHEYGSSPSEEPMDIDQFEEELENGEKRGKVEEVLSRVEVNADAHTQTTVTIKELPQEILTMIFSFMPILGKE
jgi:hypothetical protein